MDSIGSREARRQLDVMRVWKFGNASLDETNLELTVDGHAVAVERKALELLLCFLHHPGVPLSRQALCEILWPGRVVADAVFLKYLAALRRALGDEDRSRIASDFSGYRFTPPVRVESALPASFLPDNLGEIDEALR